MLRNVFLSLFVAISLIMVGCNRADRVIHITQTEDKEISVGLVLALTGQFASEIGMPMQYGFELAQKEINDSNKLGTNLIFITEDTRSISGADAFRKLIKEDGVSAILGFAISAQAKEAFPIAQEHRVVAFSPISSAPGLSAIGDFIFRASLTTDIMIPRGIEVTQKKLGYKKAALLYDASDLYSISSNSAAHAAFTESGIEILTTETSQKGENDFSGQLTKIRDLEPDVVFVSVLPPEMSLVISQARDIGIPYSVPFIIPQLNIEQVRNAGPAGEGVITFIAWSDVSKTPGNQEFVRKYTAAYGTDPNAWAAQSYATLHILTEAMVRAKSTDSTAVRDALAGITDFPTVLGQFSFDHNGDGDYNPKVLIAKDGNFDIFE